MPLENVFLKNIFANTSCRDAQPFPNALKHIYIKHIYISIHIGHIGHVKMLL